MRKLVTAVAIAAMFSAASPAFAERGDMLIKMRGSYNLRSGSDTAVVSVGGSNVSAKASNSVGAEAAADFFVSENFAVEAAFGGSSYEINNSAGNTLASAGLINPSLTLLYYPTTSARIRPYIGGGAAYVNFYSEKPGEILTNQHVIQPVTYSAVMKSNLAPVGQVGADISLDNKFYLNIDGKYMLANSKVTIVQGIVSQTVKQNMSSFVIGAGVGFKF